MVMGSTGMAYIISEMSGHVFNKGSGKGQQDHILSISRDYFIENASPQSWRDAMIKHFSYLTNKKTAFDDCLIWSQMPHSIRTDLIHHVSQESFSKITLFKSLKPSVLCALYKYTEYCMLPKDSFMYTFETGSGGLYFVLEGYAEVIDERDTSKITENEDAMVVVAAIQEGMFFGHENLLNSTFDFLGIRAKSNLFTIYIPNENVARMKKEVPLLYETLVYIIEEAVKISCGTYDVSNYVGVLKKNVSKILKMNEFIKKTESAVLLTKEREAISTNVVFKWLQSDIDEAKSLYNIFGRKHVIDELKAKKKKIDESIKSIMSAVSYEKFQAIKKKRLMLDTLAYPTQSCHSSSRNIYASLYRVSDTEKKRYTQSLSSGEPQVTNNDEVQNEDDNAGDEKKESDGGDDMVASFTSM
jgi:hypothetical protein